MNNNYLKTKLIHGIMRVHDLSYEQFEEAIFTDLEAGVFFIDTADIYADGKSEQYIGKFIAKHPEMRNKLFIQTKVGIITGTNPRYDFSYEHIKDGVNASLKRLGLDYIDSLLLHRPDALMEPKEINKAFNELKAAGKVHHFGVSNMNRFQIEWLQASLDVELEFNQLQFSLVHSGLVDVGLSVNNREEQAISYDLETLIYCQMHNIKVQAWSPYLYKHKTFIGNDKFPELNKKLQQIAAKYKVSPYAIATAWILTHPAGIQVVYGSMNPEHIKEITAANNLTLTREEWYELYIAAGHKIH